jgi:putative hemolysin
MGGMSCVRAACALIVCISICTAADTHADRVQIANPAARKCVDDGYLLEPVRAADGLPIAHDCVDPSSGKRCDAWDFFRGSCLLRALGATPFR